MPFILIQMTKNSLDQELQTAVSELLEQFNPPAAPAEDPLERRPITIWVPVEVHALYEELQGNTKKKFGKLLQLFFSRAVRGAHSKLKTNLRLVR